MVYASLQWGKNVFTSTLPDANTASVIDRIMQIHMQIMLMCSLNILEKENQQLEYTLWVHLTKGKGKFLYNAVSNPQ